MKNWFKRTSDTGKPVISNETPGDRRLFGKLLAGGSLFALGASQARAAAVVEDDAPASEEGSMRFPGDPAEHNLVYQFNKAEDEYHSAVLFSVGEMVRRYGDNIRLVVTCIGPGIHVLAKNPKRPVKKEIQERISSLSQYGVEFHACGNTLKALKWTEKDIVSFATIVDIGAVDLMELQEQGFSYISW